MAAIAQQTVGKLLVVVMPLLPLALPVDVRANPPLPVNLSGYEFLLGTNCTIAGQPATCGVQFGGWTGGNGPVPNGWTPFPGTGQGLWKASVSYTGDAAFNARVDLVSGSFDVLSTNGKTISGTVTGGFVMWPIEGQDIGCGKDIAIVHGDVTFRPGPKGVGSFEGCLHDMPAGTIIPPKIWGTLQ